MNRDGAGTGFNDPTPAAPIGGNSGTTLGQQRLNVFQGAANIWGATLTSTVAIQIYSNFGSGPGICHPGEDAGIQFPPPFPVNTANIPVANTLYVPALANKFAGVDLSPSQPDFYLRTCLTPSAFYLGFDNNHGAQVDLVSVLLHEIAHGLGFWNVTAANDGAFVNGYPSIWDRFLLDTTTSKLWVNMTEAERVASMGNTGYVVWTGANVSFTVMSGAYALSAPGLVIGGPEAGTTAGFHDVGTASFGAPLGPLQVAGQLLPALRDAAGEGGACGTLTALDSLAVSGNIALLARGGCADVVQASNAQSAGAIGAVIFHNTALTPPPGPTGADVTVTIPTIAISQVDGLALLSRLTHRGRHASGVTAAIGIQTGNPYLGADPLGRALVYTPSTWSESAASHFDPSATPNQVMEPTLKGDVLHTVIAPSSLTFALLRDIGW